MSSLIFILWRFTLRFSSPGNRTSLSVLSDPDLRVSPTPPHARVVIQLIKPPGGGKPGAVRSCCSSSSGPDLLCVGWSVFVQKPSGKWKEKESASLAFRVCGLGLLREQKCGACEVCLCAHMWGLIIGGALLTDLNWDAGPAICFSFGRCSAVFQHWQPSEWKLALTSNYILPAWQGLWGLQSDWPSVCTLFLHSHFVLPHFLILVLPFFALQWSFSYFPCPCATAHFLSRTPLTLIMFFLMISFSLNVPPLQLFHPWLCVSHTSKHVPSTVFISRELSRTGTWQAAV